MSDLNLDASIEVLTELIREKGKKVYSLFWDSGGPGAGADYELIYKFRDLYWPHSSNDGLSGPFDSLKDALDGAGIAVITSATVSITCTELSAMELAKHLSILDVEPGHTVKLNGAEWGVSSDGRLTKVQAGKGS